MDALWGALRPLAGPSEQAGQVCRWLESRGLFVERVAALDLVRCGPVPPGQKLGGPGWPWLAVLPLFDATGLARSVVFRAVATPPSSSHSSLSPKKSLKSYALAGYERRGLVLADPMGQALLGSRGVVQVPDRDGGPPAYWDGVVRLVEGEPDFLTWATALERVEQRPEGFFVSAVLGWLGSGGLPEEIARRIPAGARVVIYPHQDGAGEQAALRTRERLAHVHDVRKGRV